MDMAWQKKKKKITSESVGLKVLWFTAIILVCLQWQEKWKTTTLIPTAPIVLKLEHKSFPKGCAVRFYIVNFWHGKRGNHVNWWWWQNPLHGALFWWRTHATNFPLSTLFDTFLTLFDTFCINLAVFWLPFHHLPFFSDTSFLAKLLRDPVEHDLSQLLRCKWSNNEVCESNVYIYKIKKHLYIY